MDSQLFQPANESEAKRQEAFQFLEQMESRHNQVLEDLDQLNEKIEKVLNDFLPNRQSASSAEPPADGVAKLSQDAAFGAGTESQTRSEAEMGPETVAGLEATGVPSPSELAEEPDTLGSQERAA